MYPIIRIGQLWEFRPKKSRIKRVVARIYWKQSSSNPARKIAMIEWSHTPNSRYIPSCSLAVLFRKWEGRLLTKRAGDWATCFCTKDDDGKIVGRFAGCLVHNPPRQ